MGGSDDAIVGAIWNPTLVNVANARLLLLDGDEKKMTLDTNGFELWSENKDDPPKSENSMATKFQRPPRGDPGIELPQTACRRVSGVGKGFFTLCPGLLVEAFKARFRHVELTAHLEYAGKTIAL